MFSAVASCSHSESAPPPSDAAASEVVIEKGDTDAAIANARAALAELEKGKTDYTAVAADLLEGILNEDPQLIGVAITRLIESLPKKSTER